MATVHHLVYIATSVHLYSSTFRTTSDVYRRETSIVSAAISGLFSKHLLSLSWPSLVWSVLRFPIIQREISNAKSEKGAASTAVSSQRFPVVFSFPHWIPLKWMVCSSFPFTTLPEDSKLFVQKCFSLRTSVLRMRKVDPDPVHPQQTEVPRRNGSFTSDC